jgi:AraC family transcriptional regulator, regulatory protein of adaptative response / DNA-3-methyladenine glycosylase II
MNHVIASPPDFERCYRAVESRDARFDGWFITAVKTTGIYCRPSCPTPVRPKRENVRFYPTAAAAQLAGFRACKRCRPDASPGSPEWNVRGDLVGRAMRLIAEGIVDRDGVAGLARRLAVSERHLHRLLLTELGAGPLAIARAQRAQTARTLIETTDLPFTDVAFAAGFESVRQFNETVREVFALTPTALRATGWRRGDIVEGALTLRLPYRPPLDWQALAGWLRTRAVPGVAEANGRAYRRTLRLPRGAAIVSLEPVDGHIQCTLKLESMSDLTTAVRQCRRLLDLDADPLSVVEVLSKDRRLSSAVKKHPGLRAPGAVDGTELAIQAVLGQQVSLAAARTLTARLVTAHGHVIKIADPTLTHLFPSADAIAAADLSRLGVPQTRRATLQALAVAVARGSLTLDPGADRAETYHKLLSLPGIGEWTAGYIVMRALGDPDTFLAGDLGIRKAGARLGLGSSSRAISAHAAAWRPWRTYATHQLWASLTPTKQEVS